MIRLLSMKTITVKAFGITRDMLGAREKVIEISDESTVRQLRSTLEQQYPRLKELKSLFIAINNEYATDEKMLNEHDEIALIPPVSGG